MAATFTVDTSASASATQVSLAVDVRRRERRSRQRRRPPTASRRRAARLQHGIRRMPQLGRIGVDAVRRRSRRPLTSAAPRRPARRTDHRADTDRRSSPRRRGPLPRRAHRSRRAVGDDCGPPDRADVVEVGVAARIEHVPAASVGAEPNVEDRAGFARRRHRSGVSCGDRRSAGPTGHAAHGCATCPGGTATRSQPERPDRHPRSFVGAEPARRRAPVHRSRPRRTVLSRRAGTGRAAARRRRARSGARRPSTAGRRARSAAPDRCPDPSARHR